MQRWKTLVALLCGVASALQSAAAETQPAAVMTTENDYARIAVAANGQTLHFIDRRSGVDYCRQPLPFARVRKDGKTSAASKAAYSNGHLTLEFSQSGVTAVLQVRPLKTYFVIEVVSVNPEQIDELVFVDVPLTCIA